MIELEPIDEQISDLQQSDQLSKSGITNIGSPFSTLNSDNINDEKIKEEDQNIEEEAKKKLAFNRRILGILIIVLIAVFLTTSSELAQFIVVSTYNKPYLIVWFNTGYLIFSLPIEFIVLKFEIIAAKKSKKQKELNGNFESSPSDLEYEKSFWRIFMGKFNHDTTGPIKKKTILKTLFVLSIWTFGLSIIFELLNYLWVVGMSLAPVSITNAIYQSATIFAFFFSVLLLKEKVTILKIVAVLLFVGGVIGITVADIKTNDNSAEFPEAWKGDVLMVVSAGLWGLYEVLTNKIIGDANRTVVNTYMFLMGILSLVFGVPVIAIMDAARLEIFQLPSLYNFGLMVANGFVTYILNYLIIWGLSITSPLFVRSGELMTIPLTILFDIIVKKTKIPLISIPGFILIVAGFILTMFIESRALKKKDNLKKLDNINHTNGNDLDSDSNIITPASSNEITPGNDPHI
eukprot:gene5678-7067_t